MIPTTGTIMSFFRDTVTRSKTNFIEKVLVNQGLFYFCLFHGVQITPFRFKIKCTWLGT